MARRSGPRLLDWINTPSHLQFNPFILTGYRPASSISGCVRSLFYLHNELGNIYIHGSVLYHLFMCHRGGNRVYSHLLALDMCGVWLANSLGAIPMIQCTLVCWPSLRLFTLVMYAFLSVMAGWRALTALSTTARLQAFGWQAIARLLVFGIRWLGIGTGAPRSLLCYLRMDALALLGGLVNVARLPERWGPGIFDYWCNSHQIMHFLSVISILQMHAGVVPDLVWAASHDYACPED
ncbi:progestin and adipoQ receptor family member 4-like isoform X2 [Gracilinanus agilis]|uniref:progestin and adipoQ receptor family member 4-like isoform X2 n=1 Tax=Gracilinanus agilis TaxID=191870 RepID=UPI001CFC942F|nr:progestin and adipoQ receptor family member 4-like isoform X2 [Gracilinanus agilis]